MSNEQPSRPRRSGSSASPMGSTLAIVIAVAAVVVGFLILKSIRSDDGPSVAATTLPTAVTIDPLLPVTTFPVTPTQPQVTVFTPTYTGATVLVANSSNQNRVAGQLTTALTGLGFTMAEATDGGTKELVTKVQFLAGDAAAQAVAESVARAIGVDPALLEPIPTPALLADPGLAAGNNVIVLLGNDKAGKTLEQMTAPAAATTESTTTSSTLAP